MCLGLGSKRLPIKYMLGNQENSGWNVPELRFKKVTYKIHVRKIRKTQAGMCLDLDSKRINTD
jgi:hypothetical protein